MFYFCWCFVPSLYPFSQIHRSFQSLSHALANKEKEKNHLCLVLCCVFSQRKPLRTLVESSSTTMRPQRTSIHAISTWVRRQPPKVKAFLAVVSGMAALVLLRFIVHDHDNLFVAAEAVHSLGISVLIYKLMKEKTCAGL